MNRPPRDRALRVQTFEIADQQQSEVTPWRQPRPAVVRVEPLAQTFDVPVDVLVEDLIQSRVRTDERHCAAGLGLPPTATSASRVPIAMRKV